jgi:hypothetical protein
MALHLIKLCVGVSEVGELADWARQRRPIVHTRQTPKRAAEILDGGSLYWVIKGQVLVRQAILAIDTIEEGASSRCEILLDQAPYRTAPQPRRAFQGWRYFTADDAPVDLSNDAGEDLPAELAVALRSLGAW